MPFPAQTTLVTVLTMAIRLWPSNSPHSLFNHLPLKQILPLLWTGTIWLYSAYLFLLWSHLQPFRMAVAWIPSFQTSRASTRTLWPVCHWRRYVSNSWFRSPCAATYSFPWWQWFDQFSWCTVSEKASGGYNAMEELASPEDDYDPDDSDGEPDGYVVHADKCKRKGDKKRKKTSWRKKKSAGGSKSKGAKRVVTWTDSLTLPPPSLDSLQLLAHLSTVSSEQRTVDALGRITRHLVQPPKEMLDWDDMSLVGIVHRCDTLQDMEGVHDYKLMLSYLQLMITCDR